VLVLGLVKIDWIKGEQLEICSPDISVSRISGGYRDKIYQISIKYLTDSIRILKTVLLYPRQRPFKIHWGDFPSSAPCVQSLRKCVLVPYGMHGRVNKDFHQIAHVTWI